MTHQLDLTYFWIKTLTVVESVQDTFLAANNSLHYTVELLI